METWEYNTLRVEMHGNDQIQVAAIDTSLNELGAMGWELVTATVSEPHFAHKLNLLYTFKRRKV